MNGSQSSSQPMASSSPSLAAQKNGNLLLPSPQPTRSPVATATLRPTATVHSASSKRHSVAGLVGTGQEKQLQQQLFVLMNQDRVSQGLRAYGLNGTLSAGAHLHSQKMSVCGMSHQCPGEDEPCTRVSNEGISWTSCGENVGYTSPNPTAWTGVKRIEQNMLAEQPPDDGHRQNLLSTSFTHVGIGIYIDASGIVWATEDFAG